jgi:hypothetical protein
MQRRTHRRNLLAGSLGIALASTQFGTRAASTSDPTSATRLQEQGPDWQAVAQALGATGELMKGDVFRIGMPRTDLDVTVRDVPIKPAFALGSYAAFRQLRATAGEAMVMGDLVLLDAELNGVMSGLFAAGLMITGVHNHLNDLNPHVMYMHYMGHGDPVELAESLHQALSASATPLDGPAAPAGTPTSQATPATELDMGQLEQALGYSGKVANGGVVGFSVPRTETIMEGNTELIPSLGVATVLNFQPIGEGQAAITGDFLLGGDEVNPVAQALREHDIEVHALHNHHLAEEPRFFYMHFFATGEPATLAQGLRAALDQTNSATS